MLFSDLYTMLCDGQEQAHAFKTFPLYKHILQMQYFIIFTKPLASS